MNTEKEIKEEEKKEQPKPNFPEGGQFDKDGFWIMPQGDFYDPDGVHFSKEGKDQSGGFYDQQGVYHPKQDESKYIKTNFGYYKRKAFIPKIQGAKFNEAGFYELPSGAFYDPLGNYFDEKGYDAMGGYYNEFGQYQQAAEYFDEDENQQIDDSQYKKYDQKYQQENMHMADPENIIQKKLEADQQIQQEDDQAEEKPGLCVKQYQKEFKVEIQQKEDDQDDEQGVKVNKLKAS